jgi:hypothetical protein
MEVLQTFRSSTWLKHDTGPELGPYRALSVDSPFAVDRLLVWQSRCNRGERMGIDLLSLFVDTRAIIRTI